MHKVFKIMHKVFIIMHKSVLNILIADIFKVDNYYIEAQKCYYCKVNEFHEVLILIMQKISKDQQGQPVLCH